MKLFTNWKKKYYECSKELSNTKIKRDEYKTDTFILRDTIDKYERKIKLLNNKINTLKFEVIKKEKKSEKESNKAVKKRPGRPKKENK